MKIHKSYRMAIALCDSELLGKKFEEGQFQLDLTGSFFKGEEKTGDEVKEIVQDALREDATFNVVGQKSCELMKELGVVKNNGIRKIQGVPVVLSLC